MGYHFLRYIYMPKVFISSTGKDLADYRQRAIEVCNRLGHIPIAMEFFEAMGKGATDGSKAKLDEADLYVGIFAHRYGYIEEGFDQSVTEIEFDYAGERKLDRLCFTIDPSYPWPPNHWDPENHDRLKAFKERADKLIRNRFTTVDNFESRLLQSLLPAMRAIPNEDIFYVPHQRNPNFTGRATFLKNLRTTLTSGRPAALTQAAIHGLGGVGKSQVAIEYAYRYAADYSLVWWLRSELPESLKADYELLAKRLGLVSGEDRREQREVIEMIWDALSHRTSWLLVFDNASDPKGVKDYLPRGTVGHVLITSRYAAWGKVAKSMSVKVWEPEESIHFLLQRTGQSDEATARELAHELGHLPLALEQAAAYMEETRRPLIGYLDLFREHKLRLLDASSDASEVDATVATTWDISFRQVREYSSPAADLLNLCAFMGPDDIPVDMIVDGAEHLPEGLKTAVRNPLDLDKAIKVLRSYSLLEVGSQKQQERSLSIHRLVQLTTRERLSEGDQSLWAEAAVRTVNHAVPPHTDDVRHWISVMRLSPHAVAAVEHASKLHVGLDAAGRLLNQLGLCAMGRAEIGQAKRYYEQALSIQEEAFGADHPTAAVLLSGIGSILESQGDLDGALDYAKKALAIDERAYGPKHPEVALFARNIGQILKNKGDLAGALEYTKRALAIDEKVFGREHPGVAGSVTNLGQIFKARGDLDEALKYAKRALAIDEQAYGLEHPNVGRDANNVGNILQAQGDLAGAVKYTMRALRIEVKSYGPKHPRVAIKLSNVALILTGMGDPSRGLTLAKRALVISEEAYGPEHPQVATIANNVGHILEEEQDCGGALQYTERALRIFESTYGVDNPTTITVARNLERIRKRMK